MKSRPTSWVFALALVLLTACSSGDADYGGSGDAGSSGGGTGGGAAGPGGRGGSAGGSAGSSASAGSGSAGASGGSSANVDAGAPQGDGGVYFPPDASAPTCTVTIDPVNTSSLVNIPLGKDVKLQLRATATGELAPAKPEWQWEVIHLGKSIKLDSVMDPKDTSLLTIPTETPGDYVVTATAVSRVCERTITITAAPLAERNALMLVRVLPPIGLDVPPVEKGVVFRANQPNATESFVLQTGTRKEIAPQTQSGPLPVFVDAYVRLTAERSSLFVEGETSERNLVVQLAPGVPYSLLIVPFKTDFAPLLAQPMLPEAIPTTYNLTTGVAVSGTVVDASDRAIAGARVGMRSGALSSTQATTGADGTFLVRARRGSWKLIALPAAGSRLPEVDFDGPIALSVPDPSSVRATVRYGTVDAIDATVSVSASTGIGPVPGATLRLEAQPGELDNVATLTMATTAGAPLGTFAGRGVVRADVVADDAGSATFVGLPRARYRLTVFPPRGDTDAATSFDLDLTSATTQAVRLQPRVLVTGNVGPAAAGARLVAYDDDAPLDREPSMARVGDDGSFVLRLDPEREARMVVEPTAAGLPLAPLGRYKPARDGMTWTRKVPSTLAFTGMVASPLTPTSFVRGAVVQVFCFGAAPDCVDAETKVTNGVVPLVQAATDARGAFELRVPNPGSP